MDYTVIFSDLDKIKEIMSKLFDSNKDIKDILKQIDDGIFKDVVETQYLYMYCKLLNILKNNKSIKVLILEENLNKMKNMKIEKKIEILNTFGYFDLLLVLLNISKKDLDELTTYLNKNKKYNLKVNELDIDKIKMSELDIADKISEKILSKLQPNVNIQFNQNTDSKNQDTKQAKKNEDLQETEDIQETEDLQETKTNEEEIILPDDMPVFDKYTDEDDEEDEEEDEEENNPVKNDMNKIKNNILTEYEEEEKDEDDKVKKTNKILNNNDMKLIELLDK